MTTENLTECVEWVVRELRSDTIMLVNSAARSIHAASAKAGSKLSLGGQWVATWEKNDNVCTLTRRFDHIALAGIFSSSQQWRVHRTPCLAGSFELVSLTEEPGIDTVRAEAQLLSLMMDLCPIGVALVLDHLACTDIDGLYSNVAIRKLLGMGKDEFTRITARVITLRMDQRDAPFVLPYSEMCRRAKTAFYNFPFRATLNETPEPWRLCSASCRYLDSYYVLRSKVVEPFVEEAAVIGECATQERSLRSLLSFAEAAFMFTLCVDPDTFKVIAASERTVERIKSIGGIGIVGTLLESLIPLNQDKQTFRKNLVGANGQVSVSVKMKLKTRGRKKPLVPMDLVCYPITTVGDISDVWPNTSCAGETMSSSGVHKYVLVCIDNVQLPSHSMAAPEVHVSSDVSTPPVVAVQQPTSSPAPPGLSPKVDKSPKPSPVKTPVVSDIVLCLQRDMLISLDRMWQDSSAHCREWLCPSYKVSHADEMLEELIHQLPNNLQSVFMDAASSYDFVQCGQLLDCCTTSGGLHHLLSRPGAVCCFAAMQDGGENHDQLQLELRFFLNMIEKMNDDPRGQFMLLSSLTHGMRCWTETPETLSEFHALFVYMTTLVQISSAVSNHIYFSTEPSLHWLRESLVGALRLVELFGQRIEDGKRVLLVHWMNVLWASLMHKLGKHKESITMLLEAEIELKQECAKLPGSQLAQQMHFLVIHNIAVLYVEEGDVSNARMWLENMLNLFTVSDTARIPRKCMGIIGWFDNHVGLVNA